MRSSVVLLLTWFCLLSCFMVAMATAEVASAGSNVNERGDLHRGSLDDPEDIPNILRRIRQRATETESLFPASPLGWLHDATGQAKQEIYEATNLKLGLTLTHLFQGLSESRPGEDDWGTTTDMDFVGTWELIDKGTPTQGEVLFHAEGRWDYGKTGPSELGSASLGSVIGTANGYAEYDANYNQPFIVRNFYWRQGSPQAGWSYRLGKITPDGILSSSAHISPATTFLPTASTGPFAIALPDSGLGAVGAWYISDRAALVGLVSDANADRFNSGDIGEGDFFKAVELDVKIAPRTPKAGYSKLTLWHNDGTEDGSPINGMTGPSGWGTFVKHEQELTADGRAIGILRYGKSFDNSALYDQQASAQFLLYDPPVPGQLRNDLIGAAFTWATVPQSDARSEYNVEAFYRFPIFPHVDTTLSYQSVINPALDRDNDHASVFSLRIRTTF